MSYRREVLALEAKSISYVLRFDMNPLWGDSTAVLSKLIIESTELPDTEIVAQLKSLQYPQAGRGQARVSPIAFEALEHFRDRMLAQWLNHPFLRDILYETHRLIGRAVNELRRPEELPVVYEGEKLLDELKELAETNELDRSEVSLLLSRLTDFVKLEILATNEFAVKALTQLSRAEVELIMAEADL